MPKALRIRGYRNNQLLNNYVNACHMAGKIPFTIGFLMICIVSGFFGTIRFGKLPLQSYIFFPGILNNATIFVFLILLPAAIENKLSKLALRELQRNPPLVANKIAKREIKALREFGIRLGVLKRIKFGHIAAFLFSISNYTLSLLVAFPG